MNAPAGAEVTRAEVCAAACADAWRGDGEILASPMGLIPTIGARLARALFEPELLLSDGEATLVGGVWPVDEPPPPAAAEGWVPYRAIFDLVASGRRHVMMGPSQLDRYGNANISAIIGDGDFQHPARQLLGVRGAPGNTVNHAVSYWVPRHSRRVFVEHVDMVCGVGYDRGAVDLRVVVTNLAVLDFETPEHTMRLRSVHPGVEVAEVLTETGFDLVVPDEVAVSRVPSAAELDLIRRLDPDRARDQEVR